MNCRVKISLLAASLLLATSSVQALVPTTSASKIPTLAQEEQHVSASERVTSRLTRSHYKHFKLDDDFSEGIFERYLESLDGNKNVFTESDISSFSKYEEELDDQLKSGNNTAAYAMFNLSMKRRYERYAYALTLLDKEITFTSNESMEIDRSDESWPSNTAELNELWRQRVKYDALSLSLNDKKWPEIKDLLTRRYNNAIKRIVQSKSEDVFQLYMNSFTLQVDPHTNYLSPRSADEFQSEMSLSLEGIGAVLTYEDDYTIIRSLVTGGPASNSKQLNEGDKIIGVGQSGKAIVDVIGMRLDDVVQLIKGPKGTKVQLLIEPEEKGAKTRTVIIERDKIRLEDSAVKSKIITKLGKKIGVLEVPSFYVGLSKDTKVELEKLKKDNVDGIVVDLRNNGGGALSEAIALSGLFITKGPIVQVRDSYDRVSIDVDRDPTAQYTGKLTVLINRYSASASEIFAAAMQDYNRAIILGENSFGKGSVQEHRTLANVYDQFKSPVGYINYTIQKFYRINGGSTQMKGVEPDIYFPVAVEASETGESVADNAMPWDQIKPASYNKVASDSSKLQWIAQLKANHDQRILSDREFTFIREDIVEYKAKKDDNSISLNKAVREKESNDLEKKSLDRINTRQKANGKTIFKSLDDVPKDYEAPDAYLDEAVAITVDLIK